jgi:hypothetical protein
MRVKKIFLFRFLGFCVFLYGCGQSKKNAEEARNIYMAITKALASNKLEQDNFMKILVAKMMLAKEKPSETIVTKDLEAAYEITLQKGKDREKEITAIKEFDGKIAIKAIALDYAKHFNHTLDDEFAKVVSILKSSSRNRFDSCSKILKPILEELSNEQNTFKAVLKSFREEYEPKANEESKETSADYELVKLKDYKYTEIKIEEGTKIKLLSFSGGTDFIDEKVLYKQFIGINLTTNDTIRILALSTVQQYDFDKKPRIGIYKKDFSIRENMVAGGVEFIVFNENQVEYEKGNYKTAFGILDF